jgi:Response regulator containing CheY-like receiver domain and AraC-type DNA-binding domain
MSKLNVLVVDDELPAREMLSYLIDWKTTAFEITALAKNGRDALAKYEEFRPDLIITDIQMPVMDGLALIKAIKEISKDPKFVILSCHEQFSYAREAIKMGVTDYLIKDLITPQDLLTVLMKVQKELEEQQVTVLNDRSTKFMPQNEFYDASKSRVLKAIVLENRPSIEKQDLVDKFCLNLKSNTFVLFLVSLEKRVLDKDYSSWINIERNIFDTVEEILNMGQGGECFYYQNGEFIIIANLDDIVSELKFISRSYEIAHAVYRKIKAALDIEVTIGVSRGFYGFKDITDCYKEALSVTKYKMFLGKGKIIFYNTILSKVNSLNSDTLTKKIDSITLSLEKNDFRTLSHEVKTIYQEDLRGFMQYNYLKEVNAKMYGIILAACHKSNIKYDDIFGCSYLPIQKVEDLDTAYEIGEWFIQAFARIITIKSELESKKYSRHIKAAIEFIASNFKSNIGLSEIAEALDLHKVYLCRLFKQETGDNLANYILKLRIEEAKRIISTSNEKLYKIAEQVGYTNIQQFSAAFKKIAGVTPSEYREFNNSSTRMVTTRPSSKISNQNNCENKE